MTQTVILNKFVKYLNFISLEYIENLNQERKKLLNEGNNLAAEQLEQLKEEHLTYIKKVNDFMQGHCFGFSVCHGVMDCLGKLDWWEETLGLLCTWNENQENLEDEFILPNSENKKAIKLKALFEKALNYIFSTQYTDELAKGFLLADVTQDNLLQPGTQYFDILDGEGKRLYIQNRAIISGQFQKEYLVNLLSEDTIRDTICLIRNENHTIRLRVTGDNQWSLYDPNYDHSEKHICFTGSKEEIIDEIFKQLKTQSISIEVATFNKKNLDFSQYYQDFKNSPATFLSKGGLHMMTQQNPELLKELFNSNECNSDTQQAIAEALIITDNDNWTALHMIANCAPDALTPLFILAEKNPDIQKAIAQALIITNKDKWTILHTIASYVPSALRPLFMLADNNPDIQKSIAQALTITNKDNRNALHMIAHLTPSSVALLFVIADNSPDIQKAIVQSFSNLLKIAQDDSEFRSAVSQILTKNRSGLLHTLVRYVPVNKFLPQLTRLAQNYPEIRAAIAHDLNTSYILDWESWHANESDLDFIVKKMSSAEEWLYINALLSNSPENFNKLQIICEQNSNYINQLLIRDIVKYPQDKNLLMNCLHCIPVHLQFDFMEQLARKNMIRNWDQLFIVLCISSEANNLQLLLTLGDNIKKIIQNNDQLNIVLDKLPLSDRLGFIQLLGDNSKQIIISNEQLQRVLDKLPETDRTGFALQALDNNTYIESSEQLGEILSILPCKDRVGFIKKRSDVIKCILEDETEAEKILPYLDTTTHEEYTYFVKIPILLRFLINSIQQRSTEDTVGKIIKLKSVLAYFDGEDFDINKKDYVLLLIRDICSLSRGTFGFFHTSLNEFHLLVNTFKFKLHDPHALENTSKFFKSSDLNIINSAESVKNLLEKCLVLDDIRAKTLTR